MTRSDSRALGQSVATLTGVGPRLAEKLSRLGVTRIGDLLFLLPQRYEDRTELRALGSLAPGEKVLIEARIELAEVVYRRRRALLVRLADGTGAITLRYFHFSKAQQQALLRGVKLRCFGEVRVGPTGLEMVHPEYQVVGDTSAPPELTLTPIYPATEGLHQQRLRRLVEQALAVLESESPRDLLADLLAPEAPNLAAALECLHRPPRGTLLAELTSPEHPDRRRIALEELVAQRLSLRRRANAKQREKSVSLTRGAAALVDLRSALPFRLTSGQEQALEEILADLAEPHPMHRLLQGDVGSGKTVVAAFAALRAAASGYQAAVMAPTELLAEQHYASFRAWLEPLGVAVHALTGTVSGAARERVVASVASGAPQVVVGTHALFQAAVQFGKLALIVVDEQHRFGVQQRFELKRKGERGQLSPHQLVMTATPIPRTLAMTAYADLDCSVIASLPAGRKPVATVVMPETRRAELVARIAAHCAKGHQAYWVCPLIEGSEAIESSAALELQRELSDALQGCRVMAIHGRMKAAEKEAVMRDFKLGTVQVLVATTVIEVGVDVPNASLMVVENSERMGLAQLHQLRGRVGRGTQASSCVLLYRAPLSAIARQRLKVLRETNDGFEVAQKDMQLRGPGEVLGTRQTGVMEMRVADLLQDAGLLPEVVELSEQLLAQYPERVDALIQRWVRSGTQYAKV